MWYEHLVEAQGIVVRLHGEALCGLVVQREDAAMASRKSGFESPPVHHARVDQR